MSAKKIVIQDRMELYRIVGLVNTIGLKATAAKLECDSTTLSRWLASQGYEVKRIWEIAKVKNA